ncbi:DUF2779 domain-containing protein [Quisquiliibacterium transsilvanicum]|uniref:DUF2779 domain-containing protein n=1 Tax=Quisquiliibacterium transsilvanicum TaxID=1549638 RepID=A0A7W8M8D5_9BURK|nr:DUF2779 domain-containing protein [Quisquiliibacterium transsilvanicum]MBB5271165.1 hypothetical protein [Quisquiliibacterium transsilvanicum]
MPRLSKSRLVEFRQCPKRLWLQVRHPELREDAAATRLAFAAGHSVGEAARGLYPEGVLVEPAEGLGEALRLTRELVAQVPPRPLFEATFEHRGVLMRADLLLPQDGGWTLAEVKSSGSVKGHYLEDVAIQRWVLEGAGLPLKGVELWHLDTGWTYPGGGRYEGLLMRHDLDAATRGIAAQVSGWAAAAAATLEGGEPSVAMGEQCNSPFNCPFAAHCAAQAGAQPEYPVTLLPGNAGKRLAAQLIAEGHLDLRRVPADRFTEADLALVARVTREGEPWIDPMAARIVRALPYPRACLDFETIGFAVPVWPGTRPWQQLPFQWSCHVEHADGRLEPLEFLDLSGADPSRGCAEALVRAIPADGVVIAYNAGFERNVINQLARRFPDLGEPLTRIAQRLFDLLPVVRSHYYHRDMMGSRSIKAVLPTIGAGLDHASLGEVQDGTAAQAAYMECIAPATSPARRRELEAGLRRYCALDTLGLVELARFLAGTDEAGRTP